MSDPYLGEIRMFGGDFEPKDWKFCNGQLLAVSNYSALYSLLGTIYGGDGRTTFALPDLRSRVPVHQGSGGGLTPRKIGAKGGVENVTLTLQQIGSHTHTMKAGDDPDQFIPDGHAFAPVPYYQDASSDVSLDSGALSTSGGGGDHKNKQPFLGINFIIALTGIYPSRQ